jgi:predicted unusual protein kinase regulating ubiquinone biosynthesis (AarF/ABC1/UbiB family)
MTRLFYSNKLDERANERGLQLAQLLTQLGPTFIKVGQSLSIRTDLLSPAYARGLATLQDQVAPFDTETARRMLQNEWGVSNIDTILQDITSEPIAAASLGQVYKATLRNANNTVVAIKVQRPDIMEQIALDMYLLRESAPVIKTLFKLNTDTVGTVDAWGKGFVDELDYLQEAQNAKVFIREIAKTPLKDVVLAPRVIDEYTTRQVLVTEWINGERLDKSSAKDVAILCSVAMNTYLTMMLEIGLLHSDPHPGNLLRTPDGKLCVLDWGMVTRLDRKLQLTLIEHMAHLTSADYDEIPRDLVLLGFVPASQATRVVQDSDVVQLLAEVYGSWSKGGGAATINVNRVISQLQDLQATRGNLFQIPPYFAYIAKSFSVLEGIGLSNDPKYSIINECLPYVSKRLLTDKEAMGPALSTFLFGPNKSNIETRIVDYKRVEQLVTGFGNYTSSAMFSGAALATDTASTAPASDGSTRGLVTRRRTASQQQYFLETAADQVLDMVLTEEETPLQQILLEQLAKIISSTSRSMWTQLRERSGTLPSGRTVLGTLVDPLGLWRTSPLVRMNELDEHTVDTTRKLLVLMQKQLESNNELDVSSLSREELVDLTSILVRKVWDRRLGVVKTSNRLAMKLLQLTADKLDKGERDTRIINTAPVVLESSNSSTTSSSSSSEVGASMRIINATSVVVEYSNPSTSSEVGASMPEKQRRRRRRQGPSWSNGSDSPRLESARQMLEELQSRREQPSEDDYPDYVVLPVKTNL